MHLPMLVVLFYVRMDAEFTLRTLTVDINIQSQLNNSRHSGKQIHTARLQKSRLHTMQFILFKKPVAAAAKLL